MPEDETQDVLAASHSRARLLPPVVTAPARAVLRPVKSTATVTAWATPSHELESFAPGMERAKQGPMEDLVEHFRDLKKASTTVSTNSLWHTQRGATSTGDNFKI